MKKWILLSITSLILTAFLMFNARILDENNFESGKASKTSCQKSILVDKNQSYNEYFIFVESMNIGCIAINVRTPTNPRYEDKAPQILITPTFFTPPSYVNRFTTESPDIYAIGAIEFNFLLPSRCVLIKLPNQTSKEICSDGTRDRGGKESQQAMHTVFKYMLGLKVDSDDELVTDKFPYADINNVGSFAFSHPGMLLNTTLARWGEQLNGVSYVVMRENPTQSLFAAVELGDVQSSSGCNPLYDYSNYDSDFISLDYSKVNWRMTHNRPYFDLNENDIFDSDTDFSLHTRIPQLIEEDGSSKNLYSFELIESLNSNVAERNKLRMNQLLVSREEAYNFWNGRVTLGNDFDGNPFNAYTTISKVMPDLKQIIIFAERQHVQNCEDAPSVHQAYDGYMNNKMWTRLNPDETYLIYVLQNMGYGPSVSINNYSEIPANKASIPWRKGSQLGHASSYSGNIVSLAAIMEMMDRTYYSNWSANLSSVIHKN